MGIVAPTWGSEDKNTRIVRRDWIERQVDKDMGLFDWSMFEGFGEWWNSGSVRDGGDE